MSCETGLMLDETGPVLHETALVLSEIRPISCETGLILDKQLLHQITARYSLRLPGFSDLRL